MYGKSEQLEDYEHAPGIAAGMMFALANGSQRRLAPLRRGVLFVIHEGAMQLRLCDQLWILGPGTGIWIPPGVEGVARARSTCKVLAISVAAYRSRRLLRMPRRVNIGILLHALALTLAEMPVEPHGVRAARMARLLIDEIRYLPVTPIELPHARSPKLKTLCETVRKDPAAAPSLAQAAQMLGMSQRTLMRRFSSETGMSYAAWLRSARLIHALTQIAGGESLYGAAIASGFAGAASFCTTFKRVTGMTPMRYFSNDSSVWDTDEAMYG